MIRTIPQAARARGRHYCNLELVQDVPVEAMVAQVHADAEDQPMIQQPPRPAPLTCWEKVGGVLRLRGVARARAGFE